MSLELSSLRRATQSFSEAIAVIDNDAFMQSLNEAQRRTIEAGVIQHFEFTFELSWKFMQRWISVNRSPEEAQPRTRKELFRLAARLHLIENPSAWFVFSDARNLTSHTYEPANAQAVLDVVHDFLAAVQYLLVQLESLND